MALFSGRAAPLWGSKFAGKGRGLRERAVNQNESKLAASIELLWSVRLCKTLRIVPGE